MVNPLTPFSPEFPVQVYLFTSDHMARGTVDVPRGQRVTDVLNNPHESIVLLTEVQLNRLLLPKPQPMYVDTLRVAKQSILCVVPLDEPGPESIQERSKFVAKQRYDVILTLPGFEVHGALHLPQGTKLRSIFDLISYAFVPVTSPRIHYLFDPRRSFEANVVIVNKPRIQLFLTVEEK